MRSFSRLVAGFEELAADALAGVDYLEQPVFFGFGELDERDNVPVAESVRRIRSVFDAVGKKNYTVVVAPGVGHALWNEQHAFAPELTTALDRWLSAHVLWMPDCH